MCAAILGCVLLTVRVKLMTLTSFTKPSKRGGKYSRGILFQKGVGYVRISFMERGKTSKGFTLKLQSIQLKECMPHTLFIIPHFTSPIKTPLLHPT
jgi:hypothetical protein